ncbi:MULTISPECIES: cobaltochelatase subunit CobN [unclassified Acidisoma]|uniref:cobaltochelatase subunit CobN n=1 Tax=unclassified Acidisoma TaxID=2634065 RepID=UPI00131EB531|nr:MULTISPECIES: cobaltochelatase subunit CobN [unclassified Acidisoma]
MHLLLRETHGLEEGEAAVEPGGQAAPILFLSFSDSDLAAAHAAVLPEEFPRLRPERIGRYLHPLSVDLLCERLVAPARVVVLRLLGGLDYWRYGAEEIAATCLAEGIPLAVLPGDGPEDARLAALSTMAESARAAIDLCLRQGGAANMARAFVAAACAAGIWRGSPEPAELLTDFGEFLWPTRPITSCSAKAEDPRLACGGEAEGVDPRPSPRMTVDCCPVCPSPSMTSVAQTATIVFYRSHLLAGETATVTALADALAARGIAARALFVDSLKNPTAIAFVRESLAAHPPAVVLNLTGFSARLGDAASPLETPGVPVLQLIQAGSSRDAWNASSRGVSQADLAMQVVLPEADGRLLTTAVSFKERDTEGVARLVPHTEGIALAADRAAGWVRLAATPRAERRIAIILSDYPGAAEGGTRHEIGHAVGLDSLASLEAILRRLAAEGFTIGAIPDSATIARRLSTATVPLRFGEIIVAVQPDRAEGGDRKAGYHDPAAPPSAAYIAFYRWLTETLGIHAMIHLGTHGTLEWLPGKAAALSADCWPVRLMGGLPVIYPFIVNNPGEAAPAKRRLGAVTIGHLTPPVTTAGLHGRAAELERLIDEFAAADGLDRRRAVSLRRAILEEAASSGLLAESGVKLAEEGEDAALSRLDAYLCDVKELQIRDGLHVFGTAPPPTQRDSLLAALAQSCGQPAESLLARLDGCAEAEMTALLAALDGKFVAPGPAGAPTRGRADVLPTGRNLTTLDPRAIPTRSAMALAERAAAALLARHRQEQGEWPRALVLDLWGSATMRTGGEDLALAFILMGVAPLWDAGSSRVSGFEVVPLAVLDRPRVDVTLRISGLFRDAFAAQISLFDQAARAVAARDEAPDWNPLVASPGARVFGPAAGAYGSGVALEARDAGHAYLAGSATSWDSGEGQAESDGLALRLARASAFVHPQDHAETDILESTDYAAHEGGFAAAAALLGNNPALYHLDTSRPDAPKARLVAEEIVRVVRGRAANPVWIAGMMRHGYRGAAEIVRGVETLAGFAAMLPTRFDAQFDLLHDATLGTPEVSLFLTEANPAAHAALVARFRDAVVRDLWRPRRNSTAASLAS